MSNEHPPDLTGTATTADERHTMMRTPKGRTVGIPVIAVALLCAGLLAACGGGSSKAGAAAAATTSPSSSPSGSGGPRGAGGAGRNVFADPKVSQCLSAAGIAVPSFSARPRPTGTGATARPSFTGPRPSGSNRPGGGFGGFGGFGGNSAQSTQIQQALKACGIALPTFSRGARPSTSPTAG
jgi:hypothetical protein